MFKRKKETKLAVEFILDNTDIPASAIEKAAELIGDNPYHNPDHMIFATRAAVMIGIAEGISRAKLNYVAMVMLFHDAGHSGIATVFDEINAVKITLDNIPTEILEIFREKPSQNLQNLLRDGILATCFSTRGKYSDPLMRIIQDADIHSCGVSVEYWLYMSKGLEEEFAKQFNRPDFLDLDVFWRGGDRSVHRGFVSFLEQASGSKNIFLSRGAKKLWPGKARKFLKKIEKIHHSVRLAAVSNWRDVEDVTMEEFKGCLESNIRGDAGRMM